jgi:hypothetical protein
VDSEDHGAECCNVAALGWSALTVAAIVTTPPAKEVSEVTLTEINHWSQLSPEALAGLDPSLEAFRMTEILPLWAAGSQLLRTECIPYCGEQSILQRRVALCQ